MKPSRVAFCLFTLCCFWSLCGVATAAGQDPAAVWNGIAQAAFDPGKSASVSNLTLVRDRIRIALEDGTIQFSQPVGGVVFGAAFEGHGRLQLTAPNPIEEQQIHRFTGQDGIAMDFTEATFSFTDDTFGEVAGQVKWANASTSHLADLYQSRQRDREDQGAQIMPRLFKSVLSADRRRTMIFAVEMKTAQKGWILAAYDALDPEEVSAGRWSALGVQKVFDNWASFPAGGRSVEEAFRDPLAKADVNIRSYQIDAKVTPGAELTATTRVHFDSRVAGERVLLFGLDSNLHVQGVKDDKGTALTFFQSRERKDDNRSYGNYVAVTLADATQASQAKTLEFQYGGKRAIRRVGPGSYFCESSGWYPVPLSGNNFAKRADFELTFRSPKKFTLVATGDKTGETSDGGWTTATWKSPVPLAVAGFAFGEYKVYNTKSGSMDVAAYASSEPDDLMSGLQQHFDNPLGQLTGEGRPAAAVGSLNPAALTKTVAIEVANALNVFQNYFGPLPYTHLSVTTIPYYYGQSWPSLIYLSEVSYLDSTQRHALGIRDQIEISDFFRAHEASHQWWGHRVGWKSYHDQWLSEGFAQFSGNLYTQYRENMKEYLNRLRQDRHELFSSDRFGHVYESMGPVWMGFRLFSAESPSAYQTVVYNKGGYILHMLRMMLTDPRGGGKDPEERFKAMMQDFCKTYENKAASTGDFKAIAEKHMTRTMDLDQNHRLDWFFNEYVYGTSIPHYLFTYQVQDAGNGKWNVTGQVERSAVPEDWKDILPLYAHSAGKQMRLGWISAVQQATPFNLTLPYKPEKLSINDFDDILADIK